MKSPSLKEIDSIRKKSFRPVVVGCFINQERLLFVYKKEHDLWQLPQGGIENRELLEDAFKREMSEELGDGFMIQAEQCQFLGQDELGFPTHLHGSRKLRTDDGQEIEMKGKAYLFCRSEIEVDKLDISKSEFDDYKWIPISEANDFSEIIYQKGKRQITLRAISKL